MLFQNGCSPDRLAARLGAIAAPIFAATWSERGSRAALVVHVSAAADRRRLTGRIVEALAEISPARVRVRFHAPSHLLAPQSLESFVRRFGGEKVVYDPTGSLSRGQALISAARGIRSSLTGKLHGLYYAPRLRTLFVALSAKQVAVGDKLRIAELADIERRIMSALRNSFAERILDCPAVRVGFGVPSLELVAVDQGSVVTWPVRAARAIRRYWKPIAVATMFGFGAHTAAAEGPAVSQTNLKVTGQLGSADSESAWVAGGALTAPLGDSWGLQLEAGTAGVNDDSLFGTAAHIFTRDPDSYLLGLFAAYASENDFDLDATRLGGEAEIYLSQVTLIAKAGYQFSDTLGDGGFGDIELRWYLSDNFALSGGANFDENNSTTRLGAEWQPGFSALPGLAFRVDGVFGEDDYDSILGGLTYYFGTDASLKDRHRRQDPDTALFSLFQNVQQERDKLCAIYGC
jgi:hypothetical protein